MDLNSWPALLFQHAADGLKRSLKEFATVAEKIKKYE
jgi:hypothetical protein